jgi:hypothetical protein
MKPDPHHAAYIGLVVALAAFGFALAALGVALTVGVH